MPRVTPVAAARHLQPIPVLARESLYIGVDIGKQRHVAGFVSATLLQRHERFEGCPVLTFEQSREGFRALVERISSYVPLEQAFVLMEQTGHYHQALVQFLLELDLSVYVMHPHRRLSRVLKTDKRDALALANHLYNALEKGIQVADKTQLVRRAVPPTETAALLRGIVRHRYELVHESTRRKNKLTAICDELFPELTHILKDPNAPSALALRERFPTPQALATASLPALRTARSGTHPSDAKLVALQELAAYTIGTHDVGRQRGLVLEQAQLIAELRLLQAHIDQLDAEIAGRIAQSREGQILTSIPGVGPVVAAGIISAIGHIENFPSAAALKSYFGWAPTIAQTGTTLDAAYLKPGGSATMKELVFMMVANAIRLDSEWARLYARLVPIKCGYDERTKRHTGKVKVMGRVAGQMLSLIYALLKRDTEVLATVPPGAAPPYPIIYDPAVHRAHREGHYRSQKPRRPRGTLIHLNPAEPNSP